MVLNTSTSTSKQGVNSKTKLFKKKTFGHFWN